MRRLPGPADCRLSERVHPRKALYELFRDWQRTPTQSSAMVLRGLRQQMDVRFCEEQEPPAERHTCARRNLTSRTARSRERAPNTCAHP
jgi:hypothetical protein